MMLNSNYVTLGKRQTYRDSKNDEWLKWLIRVRFLDSETFLCHNFVVDT